MMLNITGPANKDTRVGRAGDIAGAVFLTVFGVMCVLIILAIVLG